MTENEWVEFALGIVTIVAIILGGIWTYYLFIRTRLNCPSADVCINVHSNLITSGARLVHVSIHLANTGNILIAPKYAEIRLRQVMPLPPEIEQKIKPEVDPVAPGEKELPWPQIVGRKWDLGTTGFNLEPRESDDLHADFVIDESVQIVQIHAFVGNPKKGGCPKGWPVTEFHTFLLEEKTNGR